MKFPAYFEAYGGFNSLARSPYLYCAILITALCSRFFIVPDWWELSISVIPGLVGFSIAGVAIFVSLGSDSLRAVITGKRKGEIGESPFISFMAMFTHFIVVQLMALVSALIAKAFYEGAPLSSNPFSSLIEPVKEPFWLLGGLFFIYAILLCVALAVEIYRLATMIDDYQTETNNYEDEKT